MGCRTFMLVVAALLCFVGQARGEGGARLPLRLRARGSGIDAGTHRRGLLTGVSPRCEVLVKGSQCASVSTCGTSAPQCNELLSCPGDCSALVAEPGMAGCLLEAEQVVADGVAACGGNTTCRKEYIGLSTIVDLCTPQRGAVYGRALHFIETEPGESGLDVDITDQGGNSFAPVGFGGLTGFELGPAEGSDTVDVSVVCSAAAGCNAPGVVGSVRDTLVGSKSRFPTYLVTSAGSAAAPAVALGWNGATSARYVGIYNITAPAVPSVPASKAHVRVVYAPYDLVKAGGAGATFPYWASLLSVTARPAGATGPNVTVADLVPPITSFAPGSVGSSYPYAEVPAGATEFLWLDPAYPTAGRPRLSTVETLNSGEAYTLVIGARSVALLPDPTASWESCLSIIDEGNVCHGFVAGGACSDRCRQAVCTITPQCQAVFAHAFGSSSIPTAQTECGCIGADYAADLVGTWAGDISSASATRCPASGACTAATATGSWDCIAPTSSPVTFEVYGYQLQVKAARTVVSPSSGGTYLTDGVSSTTYDIVSYDAASSSMTVRDCAVCDPLCVGWTALPPTPGTWSSTGSVVATFSSQGAGTAPQAACPAPSGAAQCTAHSSGAAVTSSALGSLSRSAEPACVPSGMMAECSSAAAASSPTCSARCANQLCTLGATCRARLVEGQDAYRSGSGEPLISTMEGTCGCSPAAGVVDPSQYNALCQEGVLAECGFDLAAATAAFDSAFDLSLTCSARCGQALSSAYCDPLAAGGGGQVTASLTTLRATFATGTWACSCHYASQNACSNVTATPAACCATMGAAECTTVPPTAPTSIAAPAAAVISTCSVFSSSTTCDAALTSSCSLPGSPTAGAIVNKLCSPSCQVVTTSSDCSAYFSSPFVPTTASSTSFVPRFAADGDVCTCDANIARDCAGVLDINLPAADRVPSDACCATAEACKEVPRSFGGYASDPAVYPHSVYSLVDICELRSGATARIGAAGMALAVAAALAAVLL